LRRRWSTWARKPSTRRHWPETDEVKKISRGFVVRPGLTGVSTGVSTVAMG
jgi:hypothetical protein